MLDITQLCKSLSAQSNPATHLPADETANPMSRFVAASVPGPKPLVVWQITRSCNLNCLDCYSDSRPRRYGAELATGEALAVIEDLAKFGVSQLQFAGGEPLLRPDLLELVSRCRELGIRPSLVTNGTFLTPEWAAALKSAGIQSVSMLLQGIGQGVDRHRGVRGAFDATVQGYGNCLVAKLEASFRIPLNRWTLQELDHFFLFIERVHIRHVVFEHLVYAGRGNNPEDDLSHEEMRSALDLILERSQDFVRRDLSIQLETSQNYTDGVYSYLQLMRQHPWRAAALNHHLQAMESGAEGAGVGLASIDAVGDVHPDPYWMNCTLGNVRSTPFSVIWSDPTNPILAGLRDRLPRLKGRCAECRWQQTCGGNMRVRAEEVYGDPWMHDPACYLTQLEIIKELPELVEVMENEVLLPEQAA
jgi:radical SAM protein with 4Fe4S-binding SPASM domain